MSTEAPRVRSSLPAFVCLALYATLRWGTMLGHSDQGRLLASFVVAVLLAAAVRSVSEVGDGERRLAVITGLTLVGLVAMLSLSGIPLAWMLTLHIGRIISTLSRGAANLPGTVLPYDGGDRGAGAVILLGAGGLMVCAALAFGSARRSPGTGRLALSALALVALAIVPSVILRPHIAFFHGMLTFLLAAVLVFSPRVRTGQGGTVAALLALLAIGGVAGGALVDNHRAWLSTEVIRVTGGDVVHRVVVDSFNWQQSYGALQWPRGGLSVLEVTASRPAYWKAEDLDTFNGRVWESGTSGATGLTGVSRATLKLYSETIDVHVGAMVTNDLISAGYALSPGLRSAVPGPDPGTWRTPVQLKSGDRYTAQVYVPEPSAAALATAGTDYPSGVNAVRSLKLPGSVYAPVEALSARLAVGRPSPYSYMEAAVAYLRAHETYTLDPPTGGPYPLLTFLETSHLGYCQQFAGALALLLRMRGIPARVAVGFLPGAERAGTNTFVVTDKQAHAWDEVFFPGYGWVTVDATPGSTATTVQPGADLASGPSATPTLRAGSGLAGAQRRRTGSTATGRTGSRSGGSGPLSLLWLIPVLALAAAILAMSIILRRRAIATVDLVAELERACARCGEPLAADVTLMALAARLGPSSPDAAGYVAALAAARYAPERRAASAAGRRALRRWLARDRGLVGRLRAAWALPPRRGGGLA